MAAELLISDVWWWCSRAAPGTPTTGRAIHLSCATANVLDINNLPPPRSTDKTKARAVNSYLNTALTLREINNDILEKRHFASNSTPTPIHWGRTITIHSPRTAGLSSKRPSHFTASPQQASCPSTFILLSSKTHRFSLPSSSNSCPDVPQLLFSSIPE